MPSKERRHPKWLRVAKSNPGKKECIHCGQGQHGNFISPFRATDSLSDLEQVSSLLRGPGSCSEGASQIRWPQATSMWSPPPGPATLGTLSPRELWAQPPEHPRDCLPPAPVRPACLPRSHTARGLLPGRAPSPWVPLQPPTRRTVPARRTLS